MIKLKALIMSILLSLNCCSQECHNLKLSTIKIDELSNSLLGEWTYAYSYINDTCIILDDYGNNSIVGELSKKYIFFKDTSDASHVDNETLKNWDSNALKDTRCEILVREEENLMTYPFLVSINSNDNLTKSPKEIVLYRNRSDNSMLGSFFIESICKEILILSDEFYYQLNDENLPNFYHIYIKTN